MKVSIYKVPFEKESRNRVKDTQIIETFLVKADVQLTTININNGSYIDIDFKYENIDKYIFNYIKIENDNFVKSSIPLYYFIVSVNKEHSNDTRTYEAHLDVIATYGQEFFNNLNGRKIDIERMHQDRINIDYSQLPSGIASINLNYGSLYNSDFDATNSTGMVKNYYGLDNSSSSNQDGQFLSRNDPTANSTTKLSNAYKGGYVYAIIDSLGSPYLEGVNSAIASGTQLEGLYLVPLRMGGGAYSAFKNLTLFQKNKVMNVYFSPFAIADINVNQSSNLLSNYIKPSTNIYFRIMGTASKTAFNGPATDHQNTWNDYYAKFSVGDVRSHFTRFFSITKMLNDYNNGEFFEMGIFNNKITKFLYSYFTTNIYNEIDVVDFLKNGNIEVKGAIDELGCHSNVKLGDNQYFYFHTQDTLSIRSDASATYLAENKNQIENAKQIGNQNIRLANANRIHEHASISGALKGIFLSGQNNVRANREFDIAKLEKEGIQAKLDDVKNTASDYRDRSGSCVAYVNNPIGNFHHNFLIETPPEIVLKNISNYLMNYGSKTSSLYNFNNELITSREAFNWIQTNNLQDYIGIEDLGNRSELSNEIVEELAKQLDAGIRIFHKNNFKLDQSNWENKVKTWIGVV